MLKVIKTALLMLMIFIAGAACGGQQEAQQGESSGDEPLMIVATTTQISDFARQVGGDAADVTQILQPNSDPHDYEPRPEDVEATARAQLVFVNGQNLDPWMGEVVSDSGGDPTVVDLSQDLPERLPGEAEGEEASEYDPHWWHDPTNVEAAVNEIRDAMVEAGPDNSGTYEQNADAYLTEIQNLDAGIQTCMDEVPADERKLVTDHDAFSYFTERYGVNAIGAVIPSQTTQGQPSAGETADLIELVQNENVRAVFPESSVNPELAQTIANETGASADYTLYGDTLGPEGSDGDTYLKMETANADAMVQGFTGGQQSCSISA